MSGAIGWSSIMVSASLNIDTLWLEGTSSFSWWYVVYLKDSTELSWLESKEVKTTCSYFFQNPSYTLWLYCEKFFFDLLATRPFLKTICGDDLCNSSYISFGIPFSFQLFRCETAILFNFRECSSVIAQFDLLFRLKYLVTYKMFLTSKSFNCSLSIVFNSMKSIFHF